MYWRTCRVYFFAVSRLVRNAVCSTLSLFHFDFSLLDEDKVLGRVPEDVCINLLEKYSTEKKSLSAEYEVILEREKTDKQDEADVDEFMSRLRKYAGATELTREMCLDLIGYVTVDENMGDRSKPRKIHIYYKFLDKELADKHNALA